MPVRVDTKSRIPFTPDLIVPESASRGSLLGQLKRAHSAARERLKEFAGKAKAIGADVRLSLEGRKEDIAALGDHILRRVDDSVGAAVPDAEQRIAKLENQIATAGKPGNGPVFEMRNQEIRRWFSRLNAEQRLEAIRRAVDESDTELLAGVLGGPKAIVRDLVATNLRRQLEIDLLKKRSPQAYSELERLREAVAIVRETAQIVESFVRSEAGLEMQLREHLQQQAVKAS